MGVHDLFYIIKHTGLSVEEIENIKRIGFLK